MKLAAFILCPLSALVLAGCASSVTPLATGGEVTGLGIAPTQTATASDVLTLPPHNAPASTASIATASAAPQAGVINEQAAAEAAAEMAREMAASQAGTGVASGQPATAAPIAGEDQTVEEQLRLREMMNRGEHHEGQPLPEDN